MALGGHCMSNSRRTFLQSGAALAAGLTGVVSPAEAQAGGPQSNMPPGAPQVPARQSGPLTPASEIQVPKMKFGGAEISRMVLGCNPFYGYAHYNNTYGTVMKEWYTQDKVCEVMHQANRFGISAFNYVHLDRGPQDWARFVSEGGKMDLIIQVTAGVDPEMLVKTLQPLALQRQGEVVDAAYHAGEMNSVKEWCKKVRDLGNGRRGHPYPGGHRAHRGGKLGRRFLLRLRLQPAAHRRRVEEAAERRDHGDGQRHLLEKRSTAHVQGNPADPEALLRLQDSGRRTDRR